MTYEPDIYRAHDDMRILGAIRDLATTAERSIDKITDRLAEANHELTEACRGRDEAEKWAACYKRDLDGYDGDLQNLVAQKTKAADLIIKAEAMIRSDKPVTAIFDLHQALEALGHNPTPPDADTAKQPF